MHVCYEATDHGHPIFRNQINFWQKDDFKIVYTCKTIFWLLIHITEVYQISHLLEYPSFI